MPTSAAQLRSGQLVMIVLIAAWLLAAAPGVAHAFDDGVEPEDEMTVSVEKTAYWTTPMAEALPRTFTEEFPPGVVCILVPELCTEEAQTVTSPVEEAMLGLQDGAEPEQLQPVPPDSLPVGVMFGEERYASGLQFETPQLPEGEDPAVVELVLPAETEPMGFDSELFREVVAAAVAQAADDPTPEPFIDVLADTAGGDTAVVEQLEPPEIMVCAPLEEWQEGENQHAEDLPDTDNCFLGGDGRAVDDGEAWAFDITGAVTAWLDDDDEFREDNHGILIVPGPVEPLDFGDPDYSTNFLGAFADPSDIELRFATAEGFDDDFADEEFSDDDFADEEFSDDDFDEGDFADDGLADEDFADDDFDGAADAEPFEPGEDGMSVDDPDVAGSGADPAPQDQPETATRETAGAGEPEPMVPWYAWLLLPLGAGGAWWYGRLHDVELPAESVASAGGGEGGAMSRLVRRVRAG